MVPSTRSYILDFSQEVIKMKKKSIVVTSVMAAVLFGFSALAWTKEADAFSDSERRELAKLPKFSVETLMDGSFMEDFEAYTLD